VFSTERLTSRRPVDEDESRLSELSVNQETQKSIFEGSGHAESSNHVNLISDWVEGANETLSSSEENQTIGKNSEVHRLLSRIELIKGLLLIRRVQSRSTVSGHQTTSPSDSRLDVSEVVWVVPDPSRVSESSVEGPTLGVELAPGYGVVNAHATTRERILVSIKQNVVGLTNAIRRVGEVQERFRQSPAIRQVGSGRVHSVCYAQHHVLRIYRCRRAGGGSHQRAIPGPVSLCGCSGVDTDPTFATRRKPTLEAGLLGGCEDITSSVAENDHVIRQQGGLASEQD